MEPPGLRVAGGRSGARAPGGLAGAPGRLSFAVNGLEVRPATPADAAAAAAIYAPVVRDTHVSFEAEPPTVEEMRSRIALTLRSHPWLVAVADGEVLGYAYGGSFRSRPAYRWSVEVSAYVRDDARGEGVGRALYDALLGDLRERGFVTALAAIALPNPPSVAFHEAFGFEPVGVFRKVGFKLGRWWDVGWWSLELRPPPEGDVRAPTGGADATP